MLRSPALILKKEVEISGRPQCCPEMSCWECGGAGPVRERSDHGDIPETKMVREGLHLNTVLHLYKLVCVAILAGEASSIRLGQGTRTTVPIEHSSYIILKNVFVAV